VKPRIQQNVWISFGKKPYKPLVKLVVIQPARKRLNLSLFSTQAEPHVLDRSVAYFTIFNFPNGRMQFFKSSINLFLQKRENFGNFHYPFWLCYRITNPLLTFRSSIHLLNHFMFCRLFSSAEHAIIFIDMEYSPGKTGLLSSGD